MTNEEYYKKRNKELEDKVRELKKENEALDHARFNRENTLRIYDIEIPLEKEMKDSIKRNIRDWIMNILKDDKNNILPILTERLINNMDYMKKLFEPAIKEIIRDLDIYVNFNVGE